MSNLNDANDGMKLRASIRYRNLSLLVAVMLITSICADRPSFAQSSVSPKGNVASNQPKSSGTTVKLALKSRTQVDGNMLKLSDLVEMTGSDAIIHSIGDLPVAPSPRNGSTQTWERNDIERILELRGIASNAIHWNGAYQCAVTRVRNNPADPVTSPTTIKSNPPVQPATFNEPTTRPQNNTAFTSTSIPAQPNAPNGIASQPSTTSSNLQFTPAFSNANTVTQAERVVIAAIESYLQTKTASDGRWIIRVKVPTEYAKTLLQRRQITGIAGGIPPWDGDQEFVLLIKTPQGEQSVTIHANVRLPEMVVAANRPLAKGYIVREEDLVWIAIPRGAPFGPEDCFTDFQSVVGRQLRKAVSTQQAIRQNEVGAPTVVHAGDMVALNVVAGAVNVATNGRAIEAGGMDDLIQVEALPSRQKIMARVTGEKTVEAIANGSSVIPKIGGNISGPTRR